jgi:hypothetical protein
MMAWEHSLLGDLGPAQVKAAADGDRGPVGGYRDLLRELGRAPRRVDEARVRASSAFRQLGDPVGDGGPAGNGGPAGLVKPG